jgi:hypothetical protein
MADGKTIQNQMAFCRTTTGAARGRTTVPARQLLHHQDPVRRAGDDKMGGGGQRIHCKAIWWQITDERGGRMTRVVDGVRWRRQTTRHVIGKGDDKGGQGGHVGALEVAGCGWWQWGRSANTRQRWGGESNIFFRMRHVVFVGSKVRRHSSFFVKYFYSKEHLGSICSDRR